MGRGPLPGVMPRAQQWRFRVPMPRPALAEDTGGTRCILAQHPMRKCGGSFGGRLPKDEDTEPSLCSPPWHSAVPALRPGVGAQQLAVSPGPGGSGAGLHRGRVRVCTLFITKYTVCVHLPG